MPLTGLGTRSISRWKSSTLRMIRATPRIGDSGGSSGCMASLTPASSATGSTRSRKYSRFSHSRSSVTSPYSVSGASLHQRVVVAGDQGAAAGRQRRGGPQHAQRPSTRSTRRGMPSRPMLRISSQTVSISSSRPGRPELGPGERGGSPFDHGQLEPAVFVELLDALQRFEAPRAARLGRSPRPPGLCLPTLPTA